MRHSCIVPECYNNSEKPSCARISFHLLTDPVLLKKWLIKICQENTPVNHNSRVCSVHFIGGKRSSDNCIPNIFPGQNHFENHQRKDHHPRENYHPKEDGQNKSLKWMRKVYRLFVIQVSLLQVYQIEVSQIEVYLLLMFSAC